MENKKQTQEAMDTLAGYIDFFASIGAATEEEANEMENSLQVIYHILRSKELI